MAAAKRRNPEAGVLDDPRSAEPDPARHWAYFIGTLALSLVLTLVVLFLVAGGG
jgi:hypothetical protein